MKGFLAACLAILPRLAGKALGKPLHLAFSYDEEAGCRGAPHLIDRLSELCARPLGAIIGEPSGLRAICGHKGKAAVRLTVQGRTGHSSRPDQGLNAIHGLFEVLNTAVEIARTLTHSPFDPIFDPPYSSLQVGTIAGGQAVNIIPDRCSADLEVRSIAGVSPLDILEPVRQKLERLKDRGYGIDWTILSHYPSISLPLDSELSKLVQELSGQPPLAAVSYGAEAGLFQAAGVDAIIFGPGDIARAHKPDEFIETDELEACQHMLERLAERLMV
jgi:acetylornithine deacetylase